MATVIRKRMMNFLKTTVFHLETDTEAVLHDDVPLHDFLNKKVYKAPEGYELTDTGIISLRNVDAGTIECTGWYYCVDCTGLPVSDPGYIEVMVHPTSTLFITQRYIAARAGYEFIRNKVEGTWGEWTLTAGEVVLWTGSLIKAGDINITMSISRFRTLVLETMSGYTLIASRKGKNSLRFVGATGPTSERVVSLLSAYMTEKTRLVLTNMVPAITVVLKDNTAIHTTELTLTRLIGMP